MSVGEDIASIMEANHELMNALKTLLEIGKYSDLSIVCGEKTYAVHRAIICSRSGFFDGACSTPFKESRAGVIDLSADDPEAVEHMVHYFYNLDYLSSPKPETPSLPSSPMTSNPASPFASRVPRKKLNLAFVEDPLLATAAANMHAAIQSDPPSLASHTDSPASPIAASPIAVTSPFSEYAPHFPPKISSFEELQSPICESATSTIAPQFPDIEHPHLVTHAKVYAIAEKYGIKGLKSLSRRKFASQVSHHYTSEEFAFAMQEVYESTVDSDRGLRDIIVQTFRSHPNLARRQDVEDIVKETPNLAWELFKVGWGLPITG